MPEIHKYTPERLDTIAAILANQADQLSPHFYEIKIDGLKVVPKTENLDLFDGHSNFITADTQTICVSIYDGHSNRNDKYIFTLKDKKEDNQSLGSLDVDAKIQKAIDAQKKQYEIDGLTRDLEQAEKDKTELQEYIEKLEELVEVKDKRKFHLGNINVAELGSVMLEGFVRRNPQLLAKIPGGEHLAGIIEADNLEQAEPQQEQPDAQASFKPKGQATDTQNISPEDQPMVDFLKTLKEAFNDDQLGQVMILLDALAEAPNLVEPSLKFIAEQTQKPQ
jgi:hypothetical protein